MASISCRMCMAMRPGGRTRRCSGVRGGQMAVRRGDWKAGQLCRQDGRGRASAGRGAGCDDALPGCTTCVATLARVRTWRQRSRSGRRGCWRCGGRGNAGDAPGAVEDERPRSLSTRRGRQPPWREGVPPSIAPARARILAVQRVFCAPGGAMEGGTPSPPTARPSPSFYGAYLLAALGGKAFCLPCARQRAGLVKTPRKRA